MSSQPYLHTKELSLTCLISSGVPLFNIVSVFCMVPFPTPATSANFSTVLHCADFGTMLSLRSLRSPCLSLASCDNLGFNLRASSALYLLSSYLVYYLCLYLV